MNSIFFNIFLFSCVYLCKQNILFLDLTLNQNQTEMKFINLTDFMNGLNNNSVLPDYYEIYLSQNTSISGIFSLQNYALDIKYFFNKLSDFIYQFRSSINQTLKSNLSFAPLTMISMKNNISIVFSNLNLYFLNSTQFGLFNNFNGSVLKFYVKCLNFSRSSLIVYIIAMQNYIWFI